MGREMQREVVKGLIDCFDYFKKYYVDVLESLKAMLEVLLIYRQNPDALFSKQSLAQQADELGISRPLILTSKMKLQKVFKFLSKQSLDQENIEAFFHIITQQKTLNKLYDYSTPLEVNQLLVGLLEIQPYQKLYNPCYGMGSVFLSLKEKKIKLFGEELDLKLSDIAHLIVRICGIDDIQLFVNDLLKRPYFFHQHQAEKFDYILCNPPMYAHMGMEFLKQDTRFAQIGALTKHYPELIFLIHSLSHLQKRGVFIVRNQVLQKSGIEAKVRQKLCEDKLISAIIELPKNIFPLQKYDFSIIVVEPHSEDILLIDANHSFFCQKDGKYNRLIHLDQILNLFKNRKSSEHSTLIKVSQIDCYDLRASVAIRQQKSEGQDTLESLGFEIIRGQRVYGGGNDEDIDFFDVGIADFKALGFSVEFSNKKRRGNIKKIKKYALKPYDLLLSLRGSAPKITILGEIKGVCVANAGVIVIRHQDPQRAMELYGFFFTHRGEECLRNVYENSADGVLDLRLLAQLKLPKKLKSPKFMEKILKLSEKMKKLEILIDQLKNEEE